MELRFGRLPSSSGNRSPSCFSHCSTSCAPESSLSSRLSPRGKSLPRCSPSFTSISPSDNFVMGCGRGGDASCLSLCWGRAFLASLFSFRLNDPTPARSWMLLTPEPRVPCCSKRIPDLFMSLRVLPAPRVFQRSIAVFYVAAAAPGANGSFASRLPAHGGCLPFPSCCSLQLFGICFQNAPSVFFFFFLNLQMDTRCSQFLLKLYRLGRAACGSEGNNRDRVGKKK